MVKDKKLQWAEYAWHNKNPFICIVVDENPTGKRLGKTPSEMGGCSED